MKHKLFSVLTALLLVVSLALPAAAATNADNAYDVTELVDVDYIESLGYDRLPELSAKYGVALHLDIVRDLEGETIQDYAKIFFDQYEYGDPDTGDGILLMLYVTEDADGLYLEEYTMYADGEHGAELGQMADYIGRFMSGLWTDAGWSGGLESDNAVLREGIEIFLNLYTGYMDGVLSMDELEQMAEVGLDLGDETIPEREPMPDVSGLEFVLDLNDELTDSEEQELNDRLAEVSAQYGCGIYCATVYDFAAQGYDDIESFGKAFYGDHGLGLGSDRDGLLLIMDMKVRKMALIGHGDVSTAAFTDYGKEQLPESYKPDFKDNRWFDGFMNYADACEAYLERSDRGEPVDIRVSRDDDVLEESNVMGSYGLAAFIGAVIAGIVVFFMKKSMNNAVEAQEAAQYVPHGGVDITNREDVYTHTTRTSRKIEDDSDDNDSDWGGTSCDSDGYSSSSDDF